MVSRATAPDRLGMCNMAERIWSRARLKLCGHRFSSSGVGVTNPIRNNTPPNAAVAINGIMIHPSLPATISNTTDTTIVADPINTDCARESFGGYLDVKRWLTQIPFVTLICACALVSPEQNGF